MKRAFLSQSVWGAVLLLFCAVTTLVRSGEAAPALIPMPRQVAWQKGGLALRRVALELPDSQRFLRAEVGRVLNQHQVQVDEMAPTKLRFREGSVEGAPPENGEAYSVSTSGTAIEIVAPQPKGWLYGWQTLRQMIERKNSTAFVPTAKIVDWPAFSWRGFMHDVGRNPQDVATLKKFADLMARYKFNVFHLHLTDNPGYRVECRIHPELNEARFQSPTRRPGFVYSYDQLRDLIAYCGERGIEVVPEIDMPGHSAYFERAFGFSMQDPRGVKILQEVVGEFLDEIKTPHFHLGGDEVHVTNPTFIDSMADFIRAKGRKVIVWRPGNLPTKGDYIVQRWPNGNQDNSAPKGVAQVDSRHSYINHMDALEALLRTLMLQPCDQKQGDALALGPTLCYWPDSNVGEESNIYRQSPVVPALLAGAERFWRGGEKVEWKHISLFPLPSDAFYPTYREFESRLLAHRDIVGKEWPFPYVKSSDIPWKLLGPIDNGGDASKSFEPETEERTSYDINGQTYKWSDAIGGTIHINHFFDYPGWLPSAKSGTAYAYTNIWSPKAQNVGFWINFNSYSHSGRRGGPNPDIRQWSNTGSKIWINGKSIEPPLWKLPKLSANSDEIPFVDEDYFYRKPTQIALKRGWNRVFIKAPRNSPTWKWQFTCVPVQIVDGVPHEVPGLRFSADLQPLIVP